MRTIVDDFGSRVWKCEVCRKTNKDKTNIRIHVETHLEGFEHHCPLCGKQSKSRKAMRKHMSNKIRAKTQEHIDNFIHLVSEFSKIFDNCL